MITVYEGDKSIKNKKCIKFVDLTFDSIIYNLKITDKDREYMKYVDNAIYKGNGYIETTFGVTEIQNLSTGCKALILINHQSELDNAIISTDECGKNVLNVIYNMDMDISIYNSYRSIPSKYNRDKHVKVVKRAGVVKQMTLRQMFSEVRR